MPHITSQLYTGTRRPATRSTITLAAVFTLVIALGILRPVNVGAAGGDVDTTFTTSVNNVVSAVAVQPDGNVVIGGGFTTVNGVARMNIARLLGTGITLAPIADAHVQGADAFRDMNFGSSPELQVKRTLNPGAGRGRRAFLRFDLSAVAGTTISSAKLRVFARLTDASLPPTGMIAQSVTDTTWIESGITWNNQPAIESSTALGQITVSGATGQLYEFDLTSFIQAERSAGRNVVGFRLINQQPTGNSGAFYTSINSKEAETNRPQLIMTVAAP